MKWSILAALAALLFMVRPVSASPITGELQYAYPTQATLALDNSAKFSGWLAFDLSKELKATVGAEHWFSTAAQVQNYAYGRLDFDLGGGLGVFGMVQRRYAGPTGDSVWAGATLKFSLGK